MADSTRQLVSALKGGDTDAYRKLVHLMGEPLLRYAATITGDHDLAHDVVQDAFLRIYRMRRKLTEYGEFRALCFRMVRNLARNAIRDESLRKRREQEASEMRGGDDHHGNAAAQAAWEHVKNLPAVLREVLELRFAFGLNRAEIADTLEVPEGTVATRQRKGLEELRNRMSVGAPAIASLLATAQPSTPAPDLFYMEELVMNGIRSMKMKAAGMVATMALVVLLVGISGAVTAYSLAGGSDAPSQTIAGTHATPETTPADNDREAAWVTPERSEREPDNNQESQPQPTPKPQPEPTETRESDPKPAPEPESSEPKFEDPQPQPAPAKEAVKVAPEFISVPAPRATVGLEYLYQVEVRAAPAAVLTADELPEWLKLEGNLLIGTPLLADAGTRVQVSLRADNGVAPGARQHFEISVDAAPEITSTPDTEAVAGKAYTYKVEVKAEPKATLTLDNAPSWLSLKGNEVSGTPDRADAGETKEIKLTASNGVKPDAVQTWTITVNTPPQFESQPVLTVKAGEAYEYEIKLSGSPEPKLEASRLPDWLKLESGKLTGKPRLAHIGKSKKITLTADNGVKPVAKQSLVITVSDNPGYVETPWTAQEVLNYLKVGMKIEWKDHESNTFMGKQIVTDAYNEVAALNGDKISFTAMRQSVKTATGKLEVEDTKFDTTTKLEWHSLTGFTPRLDRELAEDSITAGGTKWKCRVYEQDVGGGKTYRYWFSVDHPGVLVRRATYLDAASAAKDEPIAEQLIEKLTVPKR